MGMPMMQPQMPMMQPGMPIMQQPMGGVDYQYVEQTVEVRQDYYSSN
jgi:hypothetical protein